MEVMGLSTSPASGGAYALLLREVDGRRRLPIIIGGFEAQAIAMEIEQIKPPRPMTHDLLKNVIDTFGYSITEITITELREGTFYARIAVDSPSNDEIDSRPSDAVALAVRYNAPIFVSEDVLAEAGFTPEDEDDGEGQRPAAAAGPQSSEHRLIALQARLQEAIQKEDYEDAARIRDEIRTLQTGE
jgi:bifunctional DNase/RNase